MDPEQSTKAGNNEEVEENSRSGHEAPIISSSMLVSEITPLLIKHGCLDITHKLDMAECGHFPIAGGGFGDVYRGALIGGSKVAIKCARLYLQHSDEGHKVLKRVAHELYTWSSLMHPNIVELMGFANFRGQISMVSSWMDNGSLPDYISRHPEVDRILLSHHISAGLAYLHEMGRVHGDVKGSNVLVSGEGMAKITDFGNSIAKDLTLQFTETSGALNCSLRWTAPELLNGTSNVYNKEADVYALGMTILEVLTGKVPFYDKLDVVVQNGVAFQSMVPDRPLEFPFILGKGASVLWELMDHCWSHDPVGRPDSASVRDRLERLEEDISSQNLQAFPNLHALIIGINKYKCAEHEELFGCVSDAKSIFDYFEGDLQVPQNQLLCLFDKAATRIKILNSFRTHLIENKNIKPLDPIVVFFAGHSKSRMILPHDADTFDENEEDIGGISDKTLGVLVRQLYQEKGNNIVIILDCSLWGNSSRGSVLMTCPQDSDIQPSLSDTQNSDHAPPSTKHSSHGLQVHNAKTHVLLTACAANELVQEFADSDPASNEPHNPPIRGLFTFALLKALRGCKLGKTSYSALVKMVLGHIQCLSKARVDVQMQTPQCLGQYQERLMFRAKIPSFQGMILSCNYKNQYWPESGQSMFHNNDPDVEGMIRWGRRFSTADDEDIIVIKNEELTKSNMIKKLKRFRPVPVVKFIYIDGDISETDNGPTYYPIDWASGEGYDQCVSLNEIRELLIGPSLQPSISLILVTNLSPSFDFLCLPYTLGMNTYGYFWKDSDEFDGDASWNNQHKILHFTGAAKGAPSYDFPAIGAIFVRALYLVDPEALLSLSDRVRLMRNDMNTCLDMYWRGTESIERMSQDMQVYASHKWDLETPMSLFDLISKPSPA